jgi:hypothetical protein
VRLPRNKKKIKVEVEVSTDNEKEPETKMIYKEVNESELLPEEKKDTDNEKN